MLQRNRLGNTNIEVTCLSLGGLFVSKLGAEPAEARRAVTRALELGINYVDTAPGYLDSEAVLGMCLDGATQPFYLSTKLGGRPQPFDPKSRQQLYASFSESLRLLKRDYIDILYIHEPDRGGQYDWFESWDTFHGPVCDVLEDLKQKGLIRYTGLGGTTVYPLARIVERANYDVLLTAFNYSLLFREAADPLIPLAKGKGMGVVAGSPLQQGWFSESYESIIRSNPPAWLAPRRAQQMLRLYFVLSNKQVDTVLTGSRSAEEVEKNVRAAEKGPLSADVLAELEDIAFMAPFRPFEEPFGAAFRNQERYHGPGWAR